MKALVSIRARLMCSVSNARRRAAGIAVAGWTLACDTVRLMRRSGGSIARRLNVPVLTALATFIVVLVQLDLMRRQTRLMERQNEIVEAQLAQVPSLKVLQRIGKQGRTAQILFSVRNGGTKTARDFYLHLLLPARLTSLAGRPFYVPGGVSLSEASYRHEGQQYTLIEGFVALPIYPTRAADLFALSVDEETAQGTYRAHWRVVTEDGPFPPTANEWGELVIRVGAGKQ